MKVCNSCSQEKPLDLFWKWSRGKDGHQATCIVCSKEKQKQYNQTYDTKHPNRRKELRKILKEENPDYFSKVDKEYWSRKKQENPEAVYNLRRDRSYKNKYGISLQDYENILKEQDEVCAICSKENSIVKGTLKKNLLHVDHNHQTGQVRGLLCNNCNLILGMVNDDIEHLKSLISYLNKH
jgi:hypothetical protein